MNLAVMALGAFAILFFCFALIIAIFLFKKHREKK